MAYEKVCGLDNKNNVQTLLEQLQALGRDPSLNLAQKKRLAREAVDKILPMIESNKELLQLSELVLQKNNSIYAYLREEQSFWRLHKLGNTSTWHKILGAIKNQMDDNVAKCCKERYTNEEYKQFMTIMNEHRGRWFGPVTHSKLYRQLNEIPEDEKDSINITRNMGSPKVPARGDKSPVPMKDPIILQLQVMDQTREQNGLESCSYHTFKNSILTFMFWIGIFSESKFNSMVKDKLLYNDLFNATVKWRNFEMHDLTVPGFKELLKEAKNGTFDFTPHGVSKESLSRLNLDLDNKQNINISVSYCSLWPNSPGYGLTGMLDDLLTAAAAAKLARNKGKASHVFAIALSGIGVGHWITAAVTQNDQGERIWQIMDSWKNQSKHMNTVVDQIETVLTKSEAELQAYLIAAYDASTAHFFKYPYNAFFDSSTGLPKKGKQPGYDLDATEQFITNKQCGVMFTDYIKLQFTFMQAAGWLTSKGVEEEKRLIPLYSLAKFMFENVEAVDVEVKAILKPICEQLRNALGRDDLLENIYDKVSAIRATNHCH